MILKHNSFHGDVICDEHMDYSCELSRHAISMVNCEACKVEKEYRDRDGDGMTKSNEPEKPRTGLISSIRMQKSDTSCSYIHLPLNFTFNKA
jgi:hypothetical protein